MWNSWQQDILPKHEMLKDDTLGAFHGITTNIIDTGNFIANAATLDFSFQGKPFQPLQEKINTGFSRLLSENGSERFYNVSNAWNTTTSLSTLAIGGVGIAKGSLQLFKSLIHTTRFTKTNLQSIHSSQRIIPEITKQVSQRKRFIPNPLASGAHTVFRRDFRTPRITHYETFQPQTNPRNPNSWESVKRFDLSGKAHRNKILMKNINTPHIHDPKYPGRIRPADIWEIPQ